MAFQDPTFPVSLIFNPLCLDPVEDDEENNNDEALYCMPNDVLSWSGEAEQLSFALNHFAISELGYKREQRKIVLN